MSASTAPSRVSEGPPWQICPSMWPSPGGGGGGALAIPPCCVYLLRRWPRRPLAGHGRCQSPNFILARRRPDFCTSVCRRGGAGRQRSSSVLVNCTSRFTFSSVLSHSWHAKSPDSYLGGADRQAAKPTLAFGSAAVRAPPSERCTFRAFGSPRLDEPSAAAARSRSPPGLDVKLSADLAVT